MKPLLIAIIMALPSFCLSQYTYEHLTVNFLRTPAAAEAYTFQNLRLYPVHARQTFKHEFKTTGKFITLNEALSKKKVKITEKDESGTVDQLTIENVSGDTIIVLPGDIIKGGKQDRIIRKDLVLSPKSGKKQLPVFCVESGRWSDRGEVGRDKAAGVAFNGYHSKGAVSLRKVVEKEHNQQKVWNKVEEINHKNKTSTSTKTYTAISNSNELRTGLEQYRKFFKDKLTADSDVIGVVVVTGNKVLGCDMFATHDLFVGQFDGLLQSYATEAILNGKPVTVKEQTVKLYADALLNNENVQKETLKSKGSSFTHEGKKLRVSNFD